MNNKLYLSRKFLFRKKVTIFNLILISIVMCLIIVAGAYNASNQSYINNDWKKNRANSTIHIFIEDRKYDEEKMKAEMSSINHVTGVFTEAGFFGSAKINQFKTSKLDGNIQLFPATNESLPEIVFGTNFPDYEENYLICPDNFFPTNGLGVDSLKRDSALDIRKMVGKEVDSTYESNDENEQTKKLDIFNISFKIIGTYKNNATELDENVCFTNERVISEMFWNRIKNDETFEFELNQRFLVYVDNISNVQAVKTELNNLGYYTEDITIIDTEAIDRIVSKTTDFLIVFVAILFMILTTVSFKQFKDDKQYYNLLYELGYKKQNLRKIYMLSNIIQIIISSICALGLSGIAYLIIKTVVYYYPFIFYKWRIIFDYTFFSIVVIGTVLVTILLSTYQSNKINVNDGDEI